MVTLRWPLTRPSGPGGRILLEPVAALGWTGLLGDGVPDEDSRLAEFDEANLLAFSRFPGQDAVEEGLRAALGLNWTALAPGGAEAGLTVGRIFRDRAAAFSEASGLSGLASDWLIAGHLGLAGGFRLDGRTLVSDALVFGQSEGRLDWSNEDLTLAAAYVYLPADPAVNRPLTASEWTFDGELRLGERWELRADARFDVARSEPARAGLGLGWRNECVTVDVSVSRRYTSSAFVDPSTSFGLTVNLNGFSVGRGARAVSGSCG
jgi:LPS-assembly protein